MPIAQGTTERKKLTILTVGTITEVGDKKLPKLSFSATDGEKTYSYHSFNPELFQTIQNGMKQTLDCEFVVTQSGEYINRKVTQVYINGQPVAAKGAGGSRRVYGKSPEEIKSIEAQVAVKAITDLEVAGKSVILELLTLRDAWLKRALS